MMIIFTFFREWAAKRREEIRPWGTFVNTSNFEPPQSLPRWSKRLYKNIEHFQSNYVSTYFVICSSTDNVLPYYKKELRIIFYHFSQVFVFLILFLYCLITSPFLLVAMAMSGGGCYYASLKQVKYPNVLSKRIVFQNTVYHFLYNKVNPI